MWIAPDEIGRPHKILRTLDSFASEVKKLKLVDKFMRVEENGQVASICVIQVSPQRLASFLVCYFPE